MGWGGARPNSGPKPRSGGALPVAPAAKTTEAAAKPAPLKVTDHILLRSMAADRRPTGPLMPARGVRAPNPFEPAKSLHPPSSGRAATMAMDEMVTANAAWAYNAINSAWVEGTTFMGYPYLAELAQRPEYRVISETIATEMTRKGFKLQTSGDLDKTDKIQQLDAELKRLRVLDLLREVAEMDGFFGRSHIYIDTGQGNDSEELKTPIGDGWNNISKLKVAKGSLQRLATVEPVWVSPSSYNSTDPLRRDWYKPETWIVQSKQLHASRILTFVGREVPDLLKPAYSFGGVSLSQMAKPYVDNWLRTRQSVADLIHAFSVFVLSTDLSAGLQGDGDALFRRLQLFTNFRDNRGLMVTNKDTEELDNVSAPLGTLDALQAQTQEHMASVSRIPLVKLLGIQPAGLNASSEGEIRTFYDTIAAYQWKFFGQNLHRILGFAMLNLWGEVDPDIVFDFNSLWALDEKAEAEVRKIDAETGAVLINGGVLDPAEERQRIAAAPDTPYHSLDVEDLPEPPVDEGDDDAENDDGGEDPTGGKPGPGEPREPEGAAEDGAIPFAFDAEWNESDHPRGQPGNAGQFGPGGAGGGGAQKPKMTREQFEAAVAKNRAHIARWKDKLKDFDAKPRVEMRKGEHRMLASKDLSGNAPYRITMFDKNVPTGHFEVDSKDDLARELRALESQGYQEVGGEPKQANASTLYKAPTKTPDQIVADFPGATEAITKTRQRLAESVPTDAPPSKGGFKNEDGTYTPERQAVHEAILAEMFSPEVIARAMPAPGEKPTLTMLGGRGGSGKSWLTGDQGPVDASKSMLIDSDHIKSKLPGYEGWNAALYHEESTDILALVDRRALALGLNVIHDATLKTESSAVLRMAQYETAGYQVEGYYMYLGPEEAATRAMKRYSKGGTFSGRFVPPEVILGNVRNEDNFDKLSKGMKKWAVYDNSGTAPKEVSRSW